MKIACIIPARLKSTRFPRKMLAFLQNKPLLQWVFEAANQTGLFSTVAFAIDAPETAELIKSFDGQFFMTAESCRSGTDRLVELQQRNLVDADIWVNWQGDEPFIHKEMIQDLLQSCCKEKSDIWTLKKRITNSSEITTSHVTKVVCDAHDFALYFSRSVIPYYRDFCKEANKQFFKHIGLYAYTREALRKIASLPPSYLEEAEQLEQLRFLYHHLRIRVHETEHEVFGIDLPEHLERAEAFLNRS